ncbi:hypothetical protein SAMN04488128_105343 [Chitinophaga eiseniae]|uniref:Lipoprotein n=1 Tax=Chitinophaga eiseniae TaxID=634771 RepID=A0A1T4TKY4_9BACT|nr:hypothetical protein [Chitinophaga eiseniae]SKA41130.1 hypothetical protein SAMN04488128_105343 [Chitinophaga eiseniae]
MKKPFIAVFLLISLAGCKPKKAIQLREALEQKNRTAFNIVAGEGGAEGQKLQCLIKGDYQGALAALDKEEKDFDRLIDSIKSLPVTGIKQGEPLKAAAVDYYTAVKALQLFDRNEITQREIARRMKGDSAMNAHKKIYELSVQKQAMYKKVYEKDSVLQQAREKFNAEHGI